MRMVSYSINREDVLLDRLFSDAGQGFYIDIGAGDPEEGSVTKHFYDAGWRGINVEPSSSLYQRLLAGRPQDINLNVALSDKVGKMTFYECPPEFWGYSTLSSEQADRHRREGIQIEESTVEVRTLASVCEEHVEGTIDFLSIDVEGHEQKVLEGADWARWRPRVLVVEATRPNTTIPTFESWEPQLLSAGYVFGAFDGLNRFYVRREDAHLLPKLASPVNVFDDFAPFEYVRQIEYLLSAAEEAQGNLLAVTALKESLAAELSALWIKHHELSDDLDVLRSDYHALEQGVREAALNPPLPPGVGPLGLSVARLLGRADRRFPAAGSVAKVVLRVLARLRNRNRNRKGA